MQPRGSVASGRAAGPREQHVVLDVNVLDQVLFEHREPSIQSRPRRARVARQLQVVRALSDAAQPVRLLVVLTGYVTVFAFGRFVYKLYVFGHNLDPTAPLKVKPFTPAVFGTKQVANFTTTSMPQLGSLLVGIFATGIMVMLVWHLVVGRASMLRTERVAPTSMP